MKILLVNNNQVVQKLIDVTTKKVDCKLTTLASFEEFAKQGDIKEYDLVVFDQEVLEGYKGDFSFLKEIKSVLLYPQLSQDHPLISHFTYAIRKPFLPNEFLNLLVSAKQNLQNKQKEEFANLDEKEMLVDIDAEDEAEKNESLEDLLKEFDLDDSLVSEENMTDDLDALLKDLPEEEGFEQNNSQVITQQEDEGAQEREEVGELDNIQEEDVQEEDMGQILADEQISQDEGVEGEENQEAESDEGDGLNEILNESDEQGKQTKEEEIKEEYSHVGGALDLAEIAKVQNLLNDVQKSGGKIEEKSYKELELFQSLLSSRSPEGIREILDGMQLTINISFPKKEH